MCFAMAHGAQRYEVIRVIVQLVAVDMVNVKIDTPSLASFAAMLTRPFVAVFDCFADAFPVRRIIPFSNAALPGRILFAADRTAGNQRLGCGATFNANLFHGLDDSSGTHAELLSNFFQGTHVIDIFLAQPIRIMVERLRAVMAWRILLPASLLAKPLSCFPTTTSAKRSGPVRLIDWFARAMIAGFSISAALIAILFKQVANVWPGTSEFGGNFFVRRVKAVGLASPVTLANLQLLLLGK